ELTNECCSSEPKEEVKSPCCSSEEPEESACCSSNPDETSTCASNDEASLIQITPSQAKAETEACCSTTEETTEQVHDSTQKNEIIEFKMHEMDCPSSTTTIEKWI